MRIAHVTHSFPPYEAGTGRVCYFNALELSKLGHDVVVFTPNYPPGDPEYPPELHVERLPTLIRIGNAPLMPQLLWRLSGFDIIHLHYPFIFGAELVWIASKLYKTPYVLTHHNDLLSQGCMLRSLIFPLYYPVTRQLTARSADKWIVVSNDHGRGSQLTPIFERRWDDVHEVSNGVDLKHFHPVASPDIRSQYGISPDDFLVLFVGALDSAHSFKGVGRLLRCFADLAADNAQLMIVGDGDMRGGHEQIAQKLGIAPQCHFVGRINHEALAQYYTDADVLVLPSQVPESFGMVLIEAGACKTAVIASNIPGVRTVVQDGIDGYLVEAGNEVALTEKLRVLFQDRELCHQMGEAGYEKVHQHYAWSQIAPQLVRVYEAAIERHQIRS